MVVRSLIHVIIVLTITFGGSFVFAENAKSPLPKNAQVVAEDKRQPIQRVDISTQKKISVHANHNRRR